MRSSGDSRPPGPRGSLLTGNLRSYEEDRLGFLLDAHREFGGLVRFDARTTLVNEMDLADRLLRDPTGTFEVDQNVLGQRLTESEVASITDLRATLNPGLRPAAIGDVARDVSTLTTQLLAQTSSSRTIDPATFAEEVIPKAFSARLFGFGAYPFLAQVRELLDALETIIGNVFAPPATWRSPRQRRVEAMHSDLRQKVCLFMVSGHHVVRGNAEHEPLAIALANNGAGSLEQTADMLIGAMLAAQRVPASAAGWLLNALAERPSLQTDLRDEADRFNDMMRQSSTVAAADYPLALSVTLETLRLYPPTWLITRRSTRDTQLNGYHFKSGHMFLFSPYVMHRDPEIYADADTFLPERWLTSPPPPRAFASFGRGRHRCPGSDFTTLALISLMLTVVGARRIHLVERAVPDPRTSLRPKGAAVQLLARPARAGEFAKVHPSDAVCASSTVPSNR